MSWGAHRGPNYLAVEERLRIGILVVGGLYPFSENRSRSADAFLFAPYVKVPVLMVNGTYDTTYPLEESQIPLFKALGSLPSDKDHKFYPGGHGLLSLFSRQVRGDVTGWLDRYFERPKKAASATEAKPTR